MIAYERVVDRFRAEGLIVKELGTGKASAQAPGHSAADLSVSIRDIGEQVLIHSHSDPTDAVLSSLNLTLADLFDSPRGTSYPYPDGRVVSRSVDKKFRQANADGKKSLYRVSFKAGPVYLVEGEKDVHAVESCGANATCTAMGAGKAHLFDLTPLHGHSVIIVRDMDEPGAAHARQMLTLLGEHCDVQIVEPAFGKDAADHIAAGLEVSDFITADGFDADVLAAALRRAADLASDMSAQDLVQFVYSRLDSVGRRESTRAKPFRELVEKWWEYQDAPHEQIRTVPTPWPELDDALAGGLHPGRSYLFAARPGSGKSLALTNIAAHAAANGAVGMLFSVEMGDMEITSRILASGARAEYGQMTKRNMDDFNRGRVASYASDVQDMNLWVSDQSVLSIDQVRAQARAMKRTHGLDFVCVDYLQLLKPTDSRLSRERQVAEVSWGLKVMSRELDIAVVTACQTNRGSAKDKREPTIADLRESGSLENDADVVILLHRDSSGELPSGEVDLIAGKNRTGPLTTVTVPWRAHQARLG